MGFWSIFGLFEVFCLFWLRGRVFRYDNLSYDTNSTRRIDPRHPDSPNTSYLETLVTCIFRFRTWGPHHFRTRGPQQDLGSSTCLGLGVLNRTWGPQHFRSWGPQQDLGSSCMIGHEFLVHDMTWGPHHLSESLCATKLGGLRPQTPCEL